MTVAHINRIGTAVPPHDVHRVFVDFMTEGLPEPRQRRLFERMAQRAGITHRFSVLAPENLVAANDPNAGFYQRGRFPKTEARMQIYEKHAPALAMQALAALALDNETARITHLVIASCTGFVAPGVDQLILRGLGLRENVQRTFVGFMGCSAAIPALRIAQATVLADSQARVLVVNLELCTLHLQETDDLETALSFLLFGDGCAACLVSADETGIALNDFRCSLVPDSADLITWRVGNEGFVMHLSGKVPGYITRALREDLGDLFRGEGSQAIELWAVHGGGKTILDAVETGLNLPSEALSNSRAILNEHGNMSSATVMFVLKRLMETATAHQQGMAMAFGPGLAVETFRFRIAG